MHPRSLIEIILTSGTVIPAASSIPEGGVFVPKPYSQDQVEGALHQVAQLYPHLLAKHPSQLTS